ncbi:MAG: hypothetical protein V2J24_15765, partial [Pseudomonadales bacterium]|nr:hypothetical protein [Pseudomonadales bacterium]
MLPAAFARADAFPRPSMPPLADSDPVLLAARGEFLGIEMPAVLGELLKFLYGLPPASGLLLLLLILLLLSWLVHRRMTASRASRRARDVTERARHGSASVPSYPSGDVTRIGPSRIERSVAKATSKAGAGKPRRADTEVLVIDPKLKAAKATVEEEDFTALYRQAVSAPKAPAAPSPMVAESEAGGVWLEEDPVSVSAGVEIDIVEDDALFSFADDEPTAGHADEVIDEDDPLFTLPGDEPAAMGTDVDDAAGLFVLEGDEPEVEAEEEVLLVVVDDEHMTIEPELDGTTLAPDAEDDIDARGVADEESVPLALADDESFTLEIDADDAGFVLAGDEDEAGPAPSELDEAPLELLGDEEESLAAPTEADDAPLVLLGDEDDDAAALPGLEEAPLELLGEEDESLAAPTEADDAPLVLLGDED